MRENGPGQPRHLLYGRRRVPAQRGQTAGHPLHGGGKYLRVGEHRPGRGPAAVERTEAGAGKAQGIRDSAAKAPDADELHPGRHHQRGRPRYGLHHEHGGPPDVSSDPQRRGAGYPPAAAGAGVRRAAADPGAGGGADYQDSGAAALRQQDSHCDGRAVRGRDLFFPERPRHPEERAENPPPAAPEGAGGKIPL